MTPLIPTEANLARSIAIVFLNFKTDSEKEFMFYSLPKFFI